MKSKPSIKFTLLVLGFILFTSQLFAKDMGESIGLVTITRSYAETNKDIVILNENGSIWKTIDCFCSIGHSQKKCWKIAKKLDVFLYKSGMIKIKCLAKTNGLYKVVIHEKSPKIKYIAFGDHLKLETWEEYVLNARRIGFKGVILDRIGGVQIHPTATERNIFFLEPINIIGEWLEVSWDRNEFKSNCDEKDCQTGWLKWREGNELLIYAGYMRPYFF